MSMGKSMAKCCKLARFAPLWTLGGMSPGRYTPTFTAIVTWIAANCWIFPGSRCCGDDYWTYCCTHETIQAIRRENSSNDLCGDFPRYALVGTNAVYCSWAPQCTAAESVVWSKLLSDFRSVIGPGFKWRCLYYGDHSCGYTRGGPRTTRSST